MRYSSSLTCDIFQSDNVVPKNEVSSGETQIVELTEKKVVLECRSIRIGSLRGQPISPVIISTRSVQFCIESKYHTSARVDIATVRY